MAIVESVGRDLNHALRVLRRRPGPAGASVLVLALGIGVSIPLLTIVHSGIDYARSSTDAVGVVAGGQAYTLGLWSTESRTIGMEQMENLDTLLWTAGAGSVLLLAIVSINLLILLLSRGSARREEMALRGALGAAPSRVVRQLIAEGALLAAIGGAVGWAIGMAGLGFARTTWPPGMEVWIIDGPGAEVLSLALGLPVAIVLLGTLAPARGAALRNLYRSLPGGRSSAGRGERILRNAMVMLAVAASMTLLVGAGLLVRSFVAGQLESTAGAQLSENTIVVNIALDSATASGRDVAVVMESLLAEVRQIPGVEAGSLASIGSLLGLGPSDEVRAVCDACSRSVGPLFIIDGVTRHHAVSPGFFDTLGIRPIRGRDFTTADRPGAPRVAIVSQTFGYWIFPRGDPIGKQVRIGGPDGDWVTVVGIVPDVRARGIGTGAQPVPSLYLPALQYPPGIGLIAVRARGDDAILPDSLNAAISRAGAAILTSRPATLQQRLVYYEAPLGWFARVFVLLAGCAVILALLGLYGVVAFQVRKRTREIGIRMALGAQPRTVVRLIVGECLRLTATGAYLGLIGAFTLARLLQLLIFGVDPLDPITYGVVVALLSCVALVASAVPAREAARVDPLVALRYD